jgi:hypothetical protein
MWAEAKGKTGTIAINRHPTLSALLRPAVSREQLPFE